MTRYELLDRIGVGGIAEIFRGKAVAAQGFEKPVAIKRILPHLSQDRRFVELLIAEAKVLSLLKHRNIVQIFDVGLSEDGQYFLVMEFVDGKDLGTVQRACNKAHRPVPFDLVLHLGAELCEALEHAHGSRGPDGRAMSLVHRDVSPSNVLMSRAGEVKLTDFGIAKRAEHDLTHVGPMRGQFGYISPEQSRNEHLDPRSDVFSAGVLIWELLCNRPLFSGLDDISAVNAIRRGDIPRPTQINSRLPREIDAIVMSALARDKSHRHPTAEAFGNQLRTLRYSLDITTGDPAAELAKIIAMIDGGETAVPRVNPIAVPQNDFDNPEATVIRIQTVADFSARFSDASISAAKQVIERFEEEETRRAALSPEEIRVLRRAATIDAASTGSGTTAPPPRSGATAPRPRSGVTAPPPRSGATAPPPSPTGVPSDDISGTLTLPVNTGPAAPTEIPKPIEIPKPPVVPITLVTRKKRAAEKQIPTRRVARYATQAQEVWRQLGVLIAVAVVLAIASFAITRSLLR